MSSIEISKSKKLLCADCKCPIRANYHVAVTAPVGHPLHKTALRHPSVKTEPVNRTPDGMWCAKCGKQWSQHETYYAHQFLNFVRSGS